jgi:hypothetical protein
MNNERLRNGANCMAIFSVIYSHWQLDFTLLRNKWHYIGCARCNTWHLCPEHRPLREFKGPWRQLYRLRSTTSRELYGKLYGKL